MYFDKLDALRVIECLNKRRMYSMEVHTAHRRLRQFEEQDIDDFMVYRNDMDWMRYQGFKGFTRQEYIDSLLRKQYIANGLQLAIVHNESNSLIGDLYLKKEGNVCWIGYSICRAKARHGYAYEVITATIASLREKGITCFNADVEKDNIASITLLNKLNFSYESTNNSEQIFTLNL